MSLSFTPPHSSVELKETLLFEELEIKAREDGIVPETWTPTLQVLAKVSPLLPSYHPDIWCAGQHMLPRRYQVFLRGEHAVHKSMRIRWCQSLFKMATSPLHMSSFRWLTFIMEEI